MATIAQLSPNEQLDATLNEYFVKLADGYWYPLKPGVALVRIGVNSDAYQIQRRRTPTTPWMALVTASISEFDRLSFQEWARTWDLTQ